MELIDKIFKRLIYLLGLFCIGIWLFTIHTSFAFSLSPTTYNIYYQNLFVLVNGFDLKTYIPYAWGLSFSLAITAIMSLLQRTDKHFLKFAIIVALLELIGVALFNYPNHTRTWATIASVYYGIYAFFLILFYFYVKPDTGKEKKREKDEDENEKGEITENNKENIENVENWVIDKIKITEDYIDSFEKLDNDEKEEDNDDKTGIKIKDNNIKVLKVKEMYLANKSPKNIAKELDIGLSTVYRYINKNKNL
jgi:hypothetical protein